MAEEIFRARDIFYSEEGKIILRGINIHLEKGENLAVIGAYKSGKSAILDIISGRKTVDSGYIFIHGRETNSVNLLKSATISSDPILLPSLSIWENLSTVRSRKHLMNFYHSSALKASAQMLLDHFDVELDIENKPEQLTKTQQFIIELLKAYLSRPEVILVDDFNLSCTSKEKDQLIDLIKRFNEIGISFVFTGSRAELVQPFVNRISTLAEGILLNDSGVVFFSDRMTTISLQNEISENDDLENRNENGEVIWSIHHLKFGETYSFSLDFCKNEISAVIGIADKNIQILLDYIEKKLNLHVLYPYNYNKKKNAGKQTIPRVAVIEPEDLDCIWPEMSPAENLCISMPERFSSFATVSHSKMQFCWEEFLEWYKDDSRLQRRNCQEFAKKDRIALTLFRLSLCKPDLIFFINPYEALDTTVEYLFEKTVKDMATRGSSVCILDSGFEHVIKYADKYILVVE